VAKLTNSVGAIKAAGLAHQTRFRDHTHSVRRLAHQIAAWLRRRGGDSKDEVLGLTGELYVSPIVVEEQVELRSGIRVTPRRRSGKESRSWRINRRKSPLGPQSHCARVDQLLRALLQSTLYTILRRIKD
jgi:hypothetical protein